MKQWIVALGAFLAASAATSSAMASGMTPTRFINFNGVKLAVYESQGRREPGVLLIHGNTSSANSFSDIMDSAYARFHRVVAVDLAGYGASDNAPSYNTADFASEIAFAAQQTGTDDGVIAGWSLGGDLALQAASQLPNAKGYFLFGTAPLGFAPGLPAPFLTPAESYAGAAVNYGFIPSLTTQQVNDYVTAFFRPGFSPIPSFFFADGQRTDPATRAAVAVAGAGFDPTFQDEVAVARNLNVPVALLLGKKDAFVNPAYLSGLAPTIPNLYSGHVIEIPATGHAIQWERPVIFTALLAKFVKDASGCD